MSAHLLVYRHITDADFFNIYKPSGTEEGGGGQSYIDFPLAQISRATWGRFFNAVQNTVETKRTKGPHWRFPVYSMGLPGGAPQAVSIYQRRPQSICVGSQKITSARNERIPAWHPDHGFPRPDDPHNRVQAPPGLLVFLCKSYNNEIWAGWAQVMADEVVLPPMLIRSPLSAVLPRGTDPGDAGFLEFAPGQVEVNFQEPNVRPPPHQDIQEGNMQQQPNGEEVFRPVPRPLTEADAAETLFTEDVVPDVPPEVIQRNQTIIRRNKRAASALKALYGHRCQITGEDFLFLKRDGIRYTEVHHLIPLGNGGFDNPLNMIVVSPLIHRMLHYANVEGLDLNAITHNRDGSSHLDIQINGDPYRILWHPSHAKAIRRQNQ